MASLSTGWAYAPELGFLLISEIFGFSKSEVCGKVRLRDQRCETRNGIDFLRRWGGRVREEGGVVGGGGGCGFNCVDWERQTDRAKKREKRER